MNEEGEAALLRLPIELLSLIMSFVPTKCIYPPCFLICKRLHSALMDDYGWQYRCNMEHVYKQGEPLSSWKDTYKEECTFRWDDDSITREAKEAEELAEALRNDHPKFVQIPVEYPRFVGDRKEIIQNRILCPPTATGWCSVRGKRGYSEGRHSFELEILKDEGTLSGTLQIGMGVCSQFWEPRVYAYYADGQNHPTCCFAYDWWDVAGDSRLDAPPNPVKEVWKKGDVLSVTIDWNKREILYWRNGRWLMAYPIRAGVTKLWPVVTFSPGGMRIRLGRMINPLLPPNDYTVFNGN